ncbi:MAG: hypothetical protein IKI97_11325 [Clostridia bacterium]|nr:hypothetical protein [Clostridia bacterium]
MINGIIKYNHTEVPFVEKVLKLLPAEYTYAYRHLSPYDTEILSEIRIRAGSPCTFTVGNRNIPILTENKEPVCSDISQIEELTEKLCDGSVYSYSDCIKNGYIPYCGSRIGVCGTGICVDGEYTGQKKITSLVFRMPHFVSNAADKVLSYISENGFDNTMGILAVSPPNCGKTTFLRALAYGLSDISAKGLGKRVCIIDERGELANSRMSKSSLCDVICGIPKLMALEMAVRTLSPQVVIFDEIANEKQAEMLCSAYSGGVYIAASLHGKGIEDIKGHNGIRNAFIKGVFSTVYLMKKNASVVPGEIIPVSKEDII